MRGPQGGKWVRVTSTQRIVYLRCDLCGLTVKEGWAYYVGVVAHAHACFMCADAITNEEVPMTSIPGITAEHLAEVALACEAADLDWQEGRAPSTDARDFVLITERVIRERVGPEYLWLSDATHETVADALYDAQCEGRLGEWPEMAEWLAEAVTVGIRS